MSENKSKKLNKAVRKFTRKSGQQYVAALKEWPFKARWRFCWYILFGKQKRRRC